MEAWWLREVRCGWLFHGQLIPIRRISLSGSQRGRLRPRWRFRELSRINGWRLGAYIVGTVISHGTSASRRLHYWHLAHRELLDAGSGLRFPLIVKLSSDSGRSGPS